MNQPLHPDETPDVTAWFAAALDEAIRESNVRAYDGPFRKPLPCLECGGEVVWRYADDGHGDVDSIGECRDCGAWY